MDVQLQELIDKIKKDGVASAENEAAKIVAEAEKNAEKIIADAQEKVDLINSKKSPIVDKEISEYLAEKTLNLEATTDSEKAYKNADFVIISTPTNYDETKNFFDTSSVEAVIDLVQKYNKEAVVIVKSTVPVGYNDMLLEKYRTEYFCCAL